MKATPSQYRQAVQIYESAGQYRIVPATHPAEVEGPFKIQTEAVNGWADLKFSEDDGPYQAELFETLEEALSELEDLTLAFPDCEYRIVLSTHPSEVDIYQ